MNTNALTALNKSFTYPAVNWGKFLMLWESNQPISFYSWECPPRQKVKDPKLGSWINYDIDIKSVVDGIKLDEFTELPRLTIQVEEEQWFINEILKKYPNATYTKIIADTNGLYLFPKSKIILGEVKIKVLAKKFQKFLKQKARILYGKDMPKVVLATTLLEPFKNEYEMFFNLVLYSFKNSKSEFIPKSIWKHWEKKTKQHIGLTNQEKKEKFEAIKRAVASYCAEGMLLNLLDKSGKMPNPVWVNWEEPPENGITTEILRFRYGIEQIPILYFVKEKGH